MPRPAARAVPVPHLREPRGAAGRRVVDERHVDVVAAVGGRRRGDGDGGEVAERDGRKGRARRHGGRVLVSAVWAVVSHGERAEVVLGVWERDDGAVLMGREGGREKGVVGFWVVGFGQWTHEDHDSVVRRLRDDLSNRI